MVNPPLGQLTNGNSRLPRKSGIEQRQLIRIYNGPCTRGWHRGLPSGIIAGFVFK
jgi:hypothetical protein